MHAGGSHCGKSGLRHERAGAANAWTVEKLAHGLSGNGTADMKALAVGTPEVA